jgi:hypothetical protein
MACSECKKLREEEKNYYDETDRIAKIVFYGVIVVGAFAIYGVISLISWLL